MSKKTHSCAAIRCRNAGCLLLLFSLLFSVALPAYAAGSAPTRTVRVGYMDHPGFIEKNENGEFVGYSAEYLSDICKYTGWQKERAEKFLYTRHSIGLIQGMLLTLPQGENDIGNGVKSCDGKTIGIMRGSHNIEVLKDYAEQMGFTYSLKKYEYQSDLEAALFHREVDIIAAEQMIDGYDLRVLDRFASDPYYYITSKNDPELMEELDDTISKLGAYEPTYSAKLYEKYFGYSFTGNRPYFTPAESEFIASCGNITIALIPDSGPVVYADDSGEPTGVIPDIMQRISKLSGISFAYTFVPQDQTPLDFIRENPSFLASGVMAGNPAFAQAGLLLTDPYLTTYSALAVRTNRSSGFDLDAARTIGMPASFQVMHLFIREHYPGLTIVDYPCAQDGLQALADRKIDCFTYVYNSIAPYLSNPRYADIALIDRRFMSNDHCTVAMDNPENRILIGIMNKCISMIPEEDILRMENEHLQQSLYHFEQGDALHRYKDSILFAVLAIISVFALLVTLQMLRQRKYARDITLHAEYDMMTGLYNRKTLHAKSQRFLKETSGKRCAVIIVNVDDMKRLNDTRGQAAGDEALKKLANVLKNQFRGSALVGRVGGDEFGIVLSGVESKAVLVPALARLQNAIAAMSIAGGTAAISGSIGVTMGIAGRDSLDELVRQSEEALHSVKSSGKNGFAFYESQKRISMTEALPAGVKAAADPQQLAPLAVTLPPAAQNSAQVHGGSNTDYRKLFDVFPNVSVYVIQKDTHQVLFFNRRFKEICPNIQIGLSCRNLMFGPCQNCIVDTMGEQSMAHTIFYSDAFGDEVEITATQFMWQDTLPAVMISYWPRNLLTSSNNSLPSTSNQDAFDYITGGLTRAGFIHMMERMQKGGVDLTEYAILFINIKDFKAVNEMAGSDGGDNLLRTVFARVEHSNLHPVIGSRKESDHFIFMVEKSILDQFDLPALLNFHWHYNGKTLFIHCRCGIFMIDDNDLEIYKMVDRAKLAKDHIVDAYVCPYAVYEQSMLDEYSENASAFFLFDNGIKNNEFVVYYQPVVDAKTGKVVSAEALVRRKTADGAIVSPGSFIPILERTGYISMLDRFVSMEVRKFLYDRMNRGLSVVPISFNLSQKDFYDSELMELLARNLETSTLPKGSVLLEITESTYTMNEKKHGEYLKRLRNLGAKILLDDFGTGYSSFGMFENYNFDRVKLDMSFVRQLGGNENVRLVVESIISMCHKLGVQVVAEGVETEEELSILRSMDCDLIQGYYFSPPVDEASFVQYIKYHS